MLSDEYAGTNLIDRGQFNSCFYTLSNFRSMLLDHHFIALYCAFLPRRHVWLELCPATDFLVESGWKVEADKLKRAFFSKGCSSMNRAKVLCRKTQWAVADVDSLKLRSTSTSTEASEEGEGNPNALIKIELQK